MSGDDSDAASADVAQDVANDVVDDSSIDAAPDVADAGPEFPSTLTNVVLWLEASTNVTTDALDHVIAWSDRSSFKNNASASSFYAPSLVANGIGGKPSVHFASSTTGLSLDIADSNSLQWGTGDFLVAIIARFSNDPKNGQATGAANLFWKSTFKNAMGSGIALWGNVPIGSASVTDGLALLEDENDYAVDGASYHDDVPRLFVARRASQTMELRVNGTATATHAESQPVDVSASGAPATIGSLDSYYRLTGDISEIIAVRGATAPGDLAALEAYFFAKYAL